MNASQELGEVDEVPSPCVHDCRLNQTGDVCMGCRRTVAEIVEWRSMDADARRAVWKRLGQPVGSRRQRDSA